MAHGQKDFRFDERATEYDDGFEGKFSQRFYNALLAQVQLKTGDKVLDVGCGTGHLLEMMAAQQDIIGFGIDVEPEMITVAQQKQPHMTIQVATCENMPFDDDAFDVITACMAYHHFDDKVGFVQEAARVLKDDGHLYIADPYFILPLRKVINGLLRAHRTVGRFSTPDELASEFGVAGFDLSDRYKKGFVQIVELRLSR